MYLYRSLWVGKVSCRLQFVRHSWKQLAALHNRTTGKYKNIVLFIFSAGAVPLCLEPDGGQASIWNDANGHKQFKIFNACHFHVTGRVAAKYHRNPDEGRTRWSWLFAWKVLFSQTSHWPLERKPNNWDDNEVPLATNKTQSIHALFVISNWREHGGRWGGKEWVKMEEKRRELRQFCGLVRCTLCLEI